MLLMRELFHWSTWFKVKAYGRRIGHGGLAARSPLSDVTSCPPVHSPSLCSVNAVSPPQTRRRPFTSVREGAAQHPQPHAKVHCHSEALFSRHMEITMRHASQYPPAVASRLEMSATGPSHENPV